MRERPGLRSMLAATLLLALAPMVRAATSRPPALPLAPCHLDGLAEEVRCGVLDVPEDRQAIGGRSIGLHVAVLPALRREARPDPLFLLAGGPGQGARALAPLLESVFAPLRRRRDIVLVDLRGTGASGPLDCPRPAGPADPLAATAPIDAAACRAALAADVRRYTSVHAAADLDAVRAALGYARLDLWAGSYGTRTALVYARLFPARVRAVVLDGAAPFELRFPLWVARDTEAALGRLLADCEASGRCHSAFPRLGPDLRELVARLEARPATVEAPDPMTGRPVRLTVGRDELVAGLRVALYTPQHARLLPLAIHEAARGRFGPYLALLAEGTSWSTETMALGLTLSVLCSEDVSRLDDAEVEAATRGTLLGATLVRSWRTMCAAWPAGDVPPRLDETQPSPAPALILSGTLDPVTPPRWGEVMARHFPRGRHVVVPGAAHNVSFTGCVPDLIATFVESGDAASLDVSCVPTSRPPFAVGPAGTAP